MRFKKVAAALFTFAKPDCTAQVLRSLEQQKGLEYNIDWYVFQDGPISNVSGIRYATDEVVRKTLEIVQQSTLPIKKIVVNEYNECIAQQKHKAHQLFEDYNLVYFFEDDLIVGEYYLRLLKNLSQSFPKDIGMLNKHHNNGPLDRVYSCPVARLWGYYMPRSVYHKIEKGWNKYHEQAKQRDYIKNKSPQHDISLTQLVRGSGSVKLWPRTTRGRYIGNKGLLAYQKDGRLWRKNRMDNQPTQITYSHRDPQIRRFIRG